MQIEITKQSEKDFRFLLSRLSHEIRNPVTLINSELQLMASSHPELCSYRQWDSLMDNLEYVKELLKELEKLSGEKVELTVRRGGKLEKIVLQAVETAAGEYKLGIWVRDNVQGLGTVTFLTEQNEFGALGHGIHDTDTNGLMEISGGKLYRTTIQNVVKGSSGNPGTCLLYTSPSPET